MKVKVLFITLSLLLILSVPVLAEENCAMTGINPTSSAPVSNITGISFVNKAGEITIINPQFYVPLSVLESLVPESNTALANELGMPKSEGKKASVFDMRDLSGGTAADNISVPNAQAAFHGAYYATGSFHTVKGGSAVDGTLGAGIGFGSPDRAVELGMTVADVSSFSDIFFNAKVHLYNETEVNPSLAAGIENLFGMSTDQQERSAYLAASKTFWDLERLQRARASFTRTATSFGIGTGRFANKPFASVATNLSYESKAIAEYVNDGFNLGYSWASPRNKSWVLIMGWQDMFRKSSLTLGVGIGGFRLGG